MRAGRRIGGLVLVIAIAVAVLQPAAAQSVSWIRQFGGYFADPPENLADDHGEGVAVDASGNVYVVGQTDSELPGQSSGPGFKAFVRSYDSTGTERWTRQLRSNGNEAAFGVAVDPKQAVYVVGTALHSLDEVVGPGFADAFVRKYTADGAVSWTALDGTAKDDAAFGVAAAPDGSVYVVGEQNGDGILSNQGNFDAFVRKYDSQGHLVWTRGIASAGKDRADGVAVDRSGAVYVAGSAFVPASFGQQPNTQGFVRKYTADGSLSWERLIATTGVDIATDVAVDPDTLVPGGAVYVTGATDGLLPNQRRGGGIDAYVLRLSMDRGQVQWVRQIGTAGEDRANGVAVDGVGGIYVTGPTAGAMGTTPSAGGSDAYVRKYDAAGREVWTFQLGSTGSEVAEAVAIGQFSTIHFAGTTGGVLPGQESLLPFDAYVVKLSQQTCSGTGFYRRFALKYPTEKGLFSGPIHSSVEGSLTGPARPISHNLNCFAALAV